MAISKQCISASCIRTLVMECYYIYIGSGQKQTRSDIKFWLLTESKWFFFVCLFFFILSRLILSKLCFRFSSRDYIFVLMTMFFGFNAVCWFWTAQSDYTYQTKGMDVLLQCPLHSQNLLHRNDIFGITDLKVFLCCYILSSQKDIFLCLIFFCDVLVEFYL